MKQRLLLLLFLGIATFSIQAQTLIIDPLHSIEYYEDIDLTAGADLKKEVSVTNNSNEKIDLIWKRVVDEDCPSEWSSLVCDNNSCYAPFISTNVTEGGLDAPFELEAGESFNLFALHTLPSAVPGCCRIEIEFSTVQEPEVLLETLIFDVGINTQDCNFPTSTEEIAEAQLVSVFPNPTQDAFTLTNNDVVNQIDVYNSMGQKLKTYDFVNGEYHNVSDLNAGLYSLALKNAEGKILHTIMLDKK